MNYTNYSSFFGSGDVFACTSHNDLDYSINKNKKSFIKNLKLNHSNIAVPVQTHSNKKQVCEDISRSLIEKRMAACVNIYPAVLSIYRYNSEVVEDNEYLIHIKTTADKFNEIRKIIERLHNYETPEIISLEILEGNEKYLKWIQDEID